MIIVECEQGGEQWVQEKLGKPSASKASKILTNAGQVSKQRTDYLYTLAAEIVTGTKEETYQNQNMSVGIEREQEAREFYEFVKDVKVEQVGVVYKDDKKKFLCSPDGLIDNYGLEIKNVLPKTQAKYLFHGKLPSEYFSQVQFSLYVTGFKFWDFLSYCPGLRPLIIRVKRDDNFIGLLEKELISFCDDLEETVEIIK